MSDGIYNKFEMLDYAVKCLNGIPVTGSESVALMSHAFQTLFALQKGLAEEDKAKAEKVELLKAQLKAATEPKEPETGGDVIGGQHYDLNFGGAENGAG